jgi:threonine aldolase
VQLRTLEGDRGRPGAWQVEAAIRPGYYWEPRTRLVCLENTVNKTGGVVFPLEAIRAVAAVTKKHGLTLHLDGARLWNASAATGIPEAEFAAPFDTVSVCLSKGLGAPVGSVLAGPKALIKEARRFRKMFGGGMRQIGMLAAAGLFALEHHRPALAEDHEKARRLAEGIAALPAFRVDVGAVETNIVMFDVRQGSAPATIERMRAKGLLMVPFGPATIRATTHRDVSMRDIERAVDILEQFHGRFQAGFDGPVGE